jgi:hypothetical protein
LRPSTLRAYRYELAAAVDPRFQQPLLDIDPADLGRFAVASIMGHVQESLPDPVHTLFMDPAVVPARDDSPPAACYDAVADFYQAGWPDTYTDPTSVALFELLGPPVSLRAGPA